MKTNSLSERLKWARERLGWSQKTLAERSGVTQQNISKLEKNPHAQTSFVLELAEALNVSPDWLKYGIEKELSIDYSIDTIDVPLLSWDALIKHGRNYRAFVDNNKEIKMVSVPKFVGHDAFAVQVESDSMVSPTPGTISFLPGQIIGCNPSLSIDANDFVIARHKTEPKCVLRQYVTDGGESYLKPLNPQYKMEEADSYELIAVAVSYQGVLKKTA